MANNSNITSPSSDFTLNNRDAEIDEILNDANELIESVYRRLDRERNLLTAHSESTTGSRSYRRSIDRGTLESTDSPSTITTQSASPSRHPSFLRPTFPAFQTQINRNNLSCDSIDSSIGSCTSNSSVSEVETVEIVSANNVSTDVSDVEEGAAGVSFIDLSESRPSILHRPIISNDTDNDVIIVDDVVDLCTPVHETYTRVRQRRRESSVGRNIECLSADRFIERIAQSSTPNQLQASVTRRRPNNSVSPRKQQNRRRTVENQTNISRAAVVDTSTTGDSNNICICPVCMESYLKREPTSTKCGHIFCAQCIKEAVRISHKCPLCNKKLINSMLLRIYLF